MPSILFVCTGNIFRSVCAEFAFKKYLADNNITGRKVGSAGTGARPQVMYPATVAALQAMGVQDLSHTQRKLTQSIINDYDIIISMAQYHYEYIEQYFSTPHHFLFNELAIGSKTSIRDIDDEMANPNLTTEERITQTIQKIFELTPQLYTNAAKLYN